MAKKILALVCILAVLTGVSAATVLQAGASETSYQVGYARVDINPYVVDGDFSSGIMELPLRGSGDVWNRLSTDGLVDDNGDGVIDQNDGLKVTCIAVTDSNGKTVLLFTIDLIGGTLISQVRTEVCARVEEAIAAGELSNVDLSADQIFYAGTHTHNAPDTTVYTANGKTGTNDDGVDLSVVNENLGIWIDRTIEDIGDAAIAALKDRAAATLTKDQISASEATSESVAGKVMNSTRHYNTTDNTGEEFVSGDNFNALSSSEYNTARGDYPEQVTEVDDTMYLLNFSFEDTSKLPIIMAGWRGHPSLNNSDTYKNGGRNVMSSDFVNAFRHALEYGCDVVTNTTDGSGYVESWTMGAEQKYRVAYFQGTGGNVNPRGYEIQKDENGNDLTFGSGYLLRAYSWIDRSASLAAIKGRACSYGVVLADMAEEGITDSKNETAVTAGNIQTVTKSVTAARKTTGVTQASYNASVAYQSAASLYTAASTSYTTANSAYNAYVSAYDANQTAYTAYLEAKEKYEGFLGSLLYKDEYEAALSEYNSTQSACDAAKTAYDTAMAEHSTKLSEYAAFMQANTTNNYVTEATATVDYATPPDKPLQELPFLYSANGESFAIASRFHASNVIGDWNSKLGIPKTTGTTVKLSAILLGKGLAFVVVPGEPYDYYYKEIGVYTAENNLWNSLIDEDTFGKPFVLGYCNGAQGYFPNYEAYTYNEGSATKAVGSYEAHTTAFAQGFGEEMIGHFSQMLTSMVSDSRTSVCQHCKTSVTWEPYQGQTTLASGHYYLCSDYETAQIKLVAGTEVCFDINGYTLTGASRAFYTSGTDGKVVLSIMDSSEGQTGVVQGCGGEFGAANGFGGGTIFIGAGHELNLYSGTFTSYEREKHSTVTGDVLLIRGDLNMYGGTVTGGTVSSCSGEYYLSGALATKNRIGLGGNITVTGTFNMYGGAVTGGATQMRTGAPLGDADSGYANQETVESFEGVAPCVCVDVYSTSKGKLNLYGDASIDHVYFDAVPVSNLSVNGNYTGTVELQYSSKTTFAAFDVVGAANADAAGNRADVSGAAITFTGCEDLTAAVKDADLVLSETAVSYAYCEGCKAYVQWTPMTDADFDNYNSSTAVKTFPVGHYVLTENVETVQKQLNGDGKNAGTFCVDLAGFTFTGATRAFYCNSGVTLNIMDSVGGGILEGKSGSATGGAVLYAFENSTINFYGGTARHNTANSAVTLAGGVVRANGGTFNLCGGTVQGGHVTGNGGAVYVTSRTVSDVTYYGSFEASGGEVTMGIADSGGGCVYVQNGCSVTLSGSCDIADIYFAGEAADALTVDATESAFTGSALLTCATMPALGDVVGTYTGTMGMDDAVMRITDSEMSVAAVDGQLVTVLTGVNLMADGTVYANYLTLSQAVAAYTYDAETANYIKLNTDVDEAVNVAGNVYLDLNGHTVNGALTVADGAVLYCMDSQTDDYTVEDGNGYGKLVSVTCQGTGSVAGLPESSDVAADGYLMVTDTDGTSFHRVNLQITSMSLRTSNVGVYYTCDFAADEIAAAKVNKFGVALSVRMIPDETNLQFLCEYSAFLNFHSGAGGNTGSTTGTLLRNIMKTTNTDEVNLSNAATPVYGRAYIETEDGYMFGGAVVRSLQEQVAGIEQSWSNLTETQKLSVLKLYDTYASVMETWEIPNIKQAYADYEG